MSYNYLYPPKFIAGTLQRGNETEYIQGKILQLLSVNRNELVYDPNFGTPLIIFNSLSSLQADSARLQTILQTSIPEASFRVVASLIQEGLIMLIIYWNYQGQTNKLSFNINF